MNSLQILEQASVQALQGTETVNHFGFPETRQKQINPKIKSLTQERLEVNVCAQEMGFTPIAVVPLKLLHTAFKKFGLYWFEEIDGEGRVGINPSKIREEIESSIAATLAPIFLFLLFLIGYLIIVPPIEEKATRIIVGLSYVFVSSICFLVLLKVDIFTFNFSFMTDKRILSMIVKNRDLYGPKIHLYFNISSDVFAHDLNLMRQNNLQPCIAAVPQAINISRTELQQVIDKERARLAEEERRRKELETDPILYYLDGNYAVVVAQYGDFASEKKVLKWAKKHGPSWWLN
jgi:hypothetical protein